MSRWVGMVLLVAGCRQILGIDPAQIAPASDAPLVDADAKIDASLVDADMSARKKVISVDPTITGSPLAGFPLWVETIDPQIAARARADGSDIHFRSATGQILPYQIQTWEPQTGHLGAWVKLDLAGAVTFAINYGTSPDVGGEPSPDGPTVFSAYAGVWHLDDSLATPLIADATSQRNGSASGLGATNRVAGKLGAGIQFGSTSQRIQFANPLTGGSSGSHTISAWIKLGLPSSYDPVVILGDPGINRSRWMHARYAASGAMGFGFYGNDFQTDVEPVQDAWTLVHWVFENNSRGSRLYINGAEATNHVHQNGINTTGMGGYIGWAPEQWGPGLNAQTGLDGVIDEVRIATSARSAAWVNAEFRSQNAPASSYSFGPEVQP